MAADGSISATILGLLSDKEVFSLEVDGDPLYVVELAGREALSGLYEFRVEVAGPELDPEALLDRPALLTLQGDGGPRLVHGLVLVAEYAGETDHLQLYTLTIGPRAQRLQYRRDCRIFQDMTTAEVVRAVLRRAGIPASAYAFALNESYAPRNYCVQYRESDLAFVSRLLEEDGIFHFFEHHADRHVWVMADHPGAHPPIPGDPALWYAGRNAALAAGERVRSFRFGGRVQSGRVSLRDHNLHRPDLALAVEECAKVGDDLEVYDYPGEYQQTGRAGPHQGQALARIRLEALQATRRLGSGESDCPRLTAGAVFELAGHPRHELDGEYRVVQVEHFGRQPQVLAQGAAGGNSYHNRFTATELAVPFRPPQATPRPVMRGLQTATVVGPESEEIHTDDHGRIRVQFHWDRDGKSDETSTCWIRVSQQWAGNGYGALFIPRIGHEVLVDFLEGDPDRPIVTGRIYHGHNATPQPVPQRKTRTTIRTESSPGGGGFNELSFEDARGDEQVYIHAERDKVVHVKHDSVETVGRNTSQSVQKAFKQTVGTSHVTTVGAFARETVAGNKSTSVGKTLSQKAGQSIVLKAGKAITLRASRSITLKAGDSSLTLKRDGTIVLRGKTLKLQASDKLAASGKQGIDLKSSAGTINITGGPMVQINPSAALFAGRVMDLAPAAITKGAATVLIGGPQFPYEVVLLADGRIQVGPNMFIHPDPARPNFGPETLGAMGLISTTPSGQAMLANVTSSGHQMNIHYFSEWNGETQFSNGATTPGVGSNADVFWNPEYRSDNPLDPQNRSGPDATLFHEMTHGSHAMHGTVDMTPTGDAWDLNEERNTINDVYPAENDYLDDRDFPYARADHGSTTVPMDERPGPGSSAP